MFDIELLASNQYIPMCYKRWKTERANQCIHNSLQKMIHIKSNDLIFKAIGIMNRICITNDRSIVGERL